MRRPALALLTVAAAAGCGGGDGGRRAVVAVDVPLSRDPYIATTIVNGVKLAAADLGVERGDVVDFEVVAYDNAGSPSRAVANVRRAVARGATAIVSDGTGVDAAWRIAADADVPLGIVYDGDEGLVDPEERPNVFRIAPTNRGLAFRLAEYVIPKGLKVALLTDDTGYGRAGRASLQRAFAENPEALAATIQIPSSATDVAPQVVQARRAGATALIAWAEPAAIAEVLVAARSAGWLVPIFAPPAAADPIVRQEVAARPEWLDGVTFASGRLTAENGVGPWYTFAAAYREAFGLERVGVRSQEGVEVVQPPEWAMYAYDFTNVLAAAIDEARTTDGPAVLAALRQVSVRGANGDQRGFNEASHEGVVDDDVYFARFDGMVFRPVRDDALSRALPPIVQRP